LNLLTSNRGCKLWPENVATSPANPGRQIGRADGPDRACFGHFSKKPSHFRRINLQSRPRPPSSQPPSGSPAPCLAHPGGSHRHHATATTRRRRAPRSRLPHHEGKGGDQAPRHSRGVARTGAPMQPATCGCLPAAPAADEPAAGDLAHLAACACGLALRPASLAPRLDVSPTTGTSRAAVDYPPPQRPQASPGARDHAALLLLAGRPADPTPRWPVSPIHRAHGRPPRWPTGLPSSGGRDRGREIWHVKADRQSQRERVRQRVELRAAGLRLSAAGACKGPGKSYSVRKLPQR
jgi:hypothetical protein